MSGRPSGGQRSGVRGPDVTEAVVAGILGLLSVGNDPIPLRYDHQEFASEKALKDWCAEKVRTGNANWLVWHVDSMSLNTLNKLMIKLRPQLARVDSAETLGGWGLGRMSANRPYTPREQITHNAHAVSVIKKLVRGNPRAALSQIQFLFEKEAKKDAKLKASYIPELSHSTWKGIAQDLGITFHLHQKTFYQLPGDPALGVAFARRVLRETKAPGALEKAARKTVYADEARVYTVPIRPGGWCDAGSGMTCDPAMSARKLRTLFVFGLGFAMFSNVF